MLDHRSAFPPSINCLPLPRHIRRLRRILHPELFIDVFAMKLDRIQNNTQFVSDLFLAVAVAEVFEYLVFAGTELVQ